jgi:3'-5' exoribonuclease
LHDLTRFLIDTNQTAFFDYPAAVTMHHNYFNGLAYHTYSMLRLADTFVENYSSLNHDLLYSGIILHDIGKTKELSGPKQTEYTQAGNLLGHIVIGYKMLVQAGTKMNILDTEAFKALEHMIISHHGFLEYGSPREPLMAEAFALYLIDLCDSKMAALDDEVSKTEKGEYTGQIPSINKKTIYVNKLDENKDE